MRLFWDKKSIKRP